MTRDFSALTADERQKRFKLVAACSARRKRGTVSDQDYAKFVAGIDAKFKTEPIQSATEIVQVGKTFGRLTVLNLSKNGWGQTIAICSCVCGRTSKPTISAIASGTESCGCLRQAQDFSDRRLVASVRTTYKARAKQLNLEFSLDHHVIRTLILSNCFYCGTAPYREWSIVTKGGIVSVKCNGIDRVNNEHGYTVYNIVPCCPRCNYAKRDMPLTEFSAWAVKLADHLQKHGVSVVGGNTAENQTVKGKEIH